MRQNSSFQTGRGLISLFLLHQKKNSPLLEKEYSRLSQNSGFVPIDEDLWLKSVKLEWSHRDPVARIVVALAKMEQAAVIIADREIRNFFSNVVW